MDQLQPQKPDETPFIFTEEGRRQAFEVIDKGVKYAKVSFITILVVVISIVGLISYVALHFILKAW